MTTSRAKALLPGLSLVALAVAITLAQTTLATLSGRGDHWRDRYLSLWIWDGAWYSSIVEHGYVTTDPPDPKKETNLAFFPGYPITARVIYQLFNTSPGLALLLTSQLSACLFWWTFLHLMQRWRVSSSVRLLAIALIFCHPAAFFMVVTYSEALFFASLLIFLSFGPRAGRSTVALLGTMAAGYLASATRIVGAPLAIVPLLWAWSDFRMLADRADLRRIAKTIWPYVILSLSTAAGTLSYFAFCAYRFGHWDMYLRAKGAWGVGNFEITDLLRLQVYKLRMPHFAGDYLLAQDVSHVYVPVLILLLIIVPLADALIGRRLGADSFLTRAPFYVAAWIFFLALAGGSGLAKASFFLRYGLYCQILLVLALVHAYSESRYRDRELSLSSQAIVLLACTIGLALQLMFCSRFTHAVFVG